MSTTDPVLARFRAAIADLYGERIERVVLFGSRARGDARPDSDYDVLVFLKDFDLASRHEEMARGYHTGYRRNDFGASLSGWVLQGANASDARRAARRCRPVKEESVLYLEKARWHLANARKIAAPASRKWLPRAITPLFTRPNARSSSKPEISPKLIRASQRIQPLS